jgi:hypothetical protein
MLLYPTLINIGEVINLKSTLVLLVKQAFSSDDVEEERMRR